MSDRARKWWHFWKSRNAEWTAIETRSAGLKREFEIKVPVTDLKKLAGGSIAEKIETVIREINSKIVNDRGLKLAVAPQVTLPGVENNVREQSDLVYTVVFEVLPKFELADFKGITLERLTAEVTEAEIAPSLAGLSITEIPLGYGIFCSTYDFVVARYLMISDTAWHESGKFDLYFWRHRP